MSEASLLGYRSSQQETQAKWQNTACGIRFKNAPLFRSCCCRGHPVLFSSSFQKKGKVLYKDSLFRIFCEKLHQQKNDDFEVLVC